MALATVGDVEARLGRPLTLAETTRADPGLLDEASALVRAYLGGDPTVEGVVPEDVAIVVSRMVARVLVRGEASASTAGAEAVTNQVGPFGQTVRFSSATVDGSPWLTSGDKLILKGFRVDGGFAGLSISSEHTGSYRRLL